MPSAAASDPTKIEPGAEPRATLRNAVAVAELLPMKLLFTILGFARAGGYLDEADELLEAVERRGGEQVRLIEERARIAYARGDNEQALALLTLRHDRSPSATASIAIARLYLETGALDEARAISEELSASQGHLVTVKQLAADVARASGDSELARSHLLALVDERGEHPPSLLSLAHVSLDDGDVESAAAFFRRATVDAENLNANQLLQASGVAAAIGEQTLADAFRDQADSFQHQRSHALIREIEAAVHAVPKPNVVPHQPEPRTRAIPKPAKAKREHTVALHVEQGSLVPDDPRVIQVLHEDFGHERLRPGQSAVIANVLAGLDTLAIMPTGVGKSLTFQLPAMLDECTTVVISPLIALMKDQVESLPDGIRSRTALINSTLSGEEMRARLGRLARGELKLVYVAPERLRNYGFLRALRNAGVGRVVVDEAHCISMWGHDFRPDYLFIPRALTELDEPPVLGITATATPDMVDQIGRGLGRELSVVRTSVFRPNLRYEVHHLPNKEAKLERVIQICRSERGSGIVYVSSRRDTESIAGLLRQRGVYAVPYHAGLDSELRGRNQDEFMRGRARVVVATVAFGMGVNKADVRFIVHLVPPRSLEAYAQESGRAGRDGQSARCILLVSPSDRAQLVTNARRDELDLAALRRVYGLLMRHARGPWVIIDPAVLRATGDNDEQEYDPRVALGILEQAGLIRRHPDAPATYELRRVSRPLDEVGDPELAGAWQTVELSLPTSWATRGACTITTAETCSFTQITPIDLDRALQAQPTVAAREGARSLCLYLEQMTGDAAKTLSEILERSSKSAMERIDLVLRYANDARCRHASLAEHLGERLDDCVTACDVCTGTADQAVTRSTSGAMRSVFTPQDALLVLEAVKTLPFPMGKTGIVRLLLGSIESTVRADRSASFGALTGFSKGKVESLVERLIEAGFLYRDEQHEYRLISLTEAGAEAGLDDLQAFDDAQTQRPLRAPITDRELDPAESRLYQRLTEWRRAKSVEEALPAYVVASNSTLQNLAVSRPATRTALQSVPGIGPKSIEKYGSELLALIGDDRQRDQVG